MEIGGAIAVNMIFRRRFRQCFHIAGQDDFLRFVVFHCGFLNLPLANAGLMLSPRALESKQYQGSPTTRGRTRPEDSFGMLPASAQSGPCANAALLAMRGKKQDRVPILFLILQTLCPLIRAELIDLRCFDAPSGVIGYA